MICDLDCQPVEIRDRNGDDFLLPAPDDIDRYEYSLLNKYGIILL
jgi:hypothetical protein